MRSEAYNMDCMEYMRTLPDNSFELAIVDPPYGGVTQGGYSTNQVSGGIAKNRNDYHLAVWNFSKPSPEYFNELFRVSINQIIWGGNYFVSELKKDSQCWLVWDKEKPVGVKYAEVELAWTSFNSRARIFHYMWNGMLQGDMKHKQQKIHPTEKPVALYEWILKNYANEGDKILDTHLGSGSSRIAAYNMGFDFVGTEIDEVYFKQQEERFEKYTDQYRLEL